MAPTLLVLMLALAAVPDPQLPSDADRRAVIQVTQAYRDAWLANDATRVMATLTADAVILPSGLHPIQGAAAIRAFWFPAGTITTITAMELTVQSVHVGGDVATVRGEGTLTYVSGGSGAATAPVTLRSWFVNVLRKQSDGRWLIAERAWSDLKQ